MSREKREGVKMEKRSVVAAFFVLSLFSFFTVSQNAAAESDQSKQKIGLLVSSNAPPPVSVQKGTVQVQDFSVPAVKGGIIGPPDSQGAITPIDSKGSIVQQDKAFDVFHKHTGEIKAAFAKGGIVGPDEIVGPEEMPAMDGASKEGHFKMGGESEAGGGIFHKAGSSLSEACADGTTDCASGQHTPAPGGMGGEGEAGGGIFHKHMPTDGGVIVEGKQERPAGFDVFHKGESEGILIGLNKTSVKGESVPTDHGSLKVREAAIKGDSAMGNEKIDAAVDIFHKGETESGAVVGISEAVEAVGPESP